MNRTLLFLIVSAVSLVACHRESNTSMQSAQPQQEQSPANAHYDIAEPPLSVEVRKGDLVSIRNMVTQGGDVNATDLIGDTPLHIACFYHRQDAAELLLASGANVNAKDMHGFTPLHAAVMSGSPELITLLISKGANVNALANDGLTPLHVAAAIGAYHLITILLAHGADISLRDQSGRTAQAYALKNGHDQSAELLQKTNSLKTPSPPA